MKPVNLELAPLSFIDSFKQGLCATNKCIILTFTALKSIFNERKMDGVGGPLIVILNN